MNVRSAEAGTAPDEQKVSALMAQVDRLVGERRDAEAQRLLGEAAARLYDGAGVIVDATFAAPAGVWAPNPPSATNRATASSDTSQPVTSRPARRSEVAMPKPIEPSPMTATCGFGEPDSAMRQTPWFLHSRNS